MSAEPIAPVPSGADAPPLRRRMLIIFSILITVLLWFIAEWHSRIAIGNGGGDFKYLYGAGKLVLSGEGARLYEPGILSGISNAHGPFEALLFVPLAFLPYAQAVWVWWLVNLILAFASLLLLLPLLPRVSAHLEFAILSLGTFLPILVAEAVGQDTLLTFLLFAACLRSISSRRFWITGAVLSLAMYKPNLALPLFVMIAMTSPNSVPIIAAFFLGCLFVLLISISVLGVSTVFAYPRTMLHFVGSKSDASVPDMPNIRGLVNWFSQTHLSKTSILLIVAAISILVLALSIWSVRKGDAIEHKGQLGFGAFAVATLMVGYHDYAYDLTLLLVPIFLVWDWTMRPRVQTLPRKVLRYSVPFLIACSPFILFKPQIYTVAIVLFFLLICLELQNSPEEPHHESEGTRPAESLRLKQQA